jgi:hypothetical protein
MFVLIAFIEKGVLRSYTIDEKGNEHIMQFGFEGWWITDLSSYLMGANSDILLKQLKIQNCCFNYSQEELMIQLPAFERYQRLLQNAYIALQARVNRL